jgi:hypothetical protein
LLKRKRSKGKTNNIILKLILPQTLDLNLSSTKTGVREKDNRGKYILIISMKGYTTPKIKPET